MDEANGAADIGNDKVTSIVALEEEAANESERGDQQGQDQEGKEYSREKYNTCGNIVTHKYTVRCTQYCLILSI